MLWRISDARIGPTFSIVDMLTLSLGNADGTGTEADLAVSTRDCAREEWPNIKKYRTRTVTWNMLDDYFSQTKLVIER